MSMIHNELWKYLEAVEPSSSFCHGGVAAWEPPGLEIEGVGPIGLPMGERQALQIAGVAGRAPYGKGDETLVDLSVRRVWQIEPGHLQFANPTWSESVDRIVAEVKAEFEIAQPVQAELYKLLLYEPGGFFVPHRDTEKTRGMFATLVLCLPSPHQGGDLVVEHDGRVQVVSFSKHSASRLQFAAFYADCRHEVRPIESGYRVCLVYNLSTTGTPLRPPTVEHLVEEVAQSLRQTFDQGGLAKLAVPLSHEYSQESLSQDRLKGQDRSRYHLLLQAASRLHWEAHLSQLNWYQEGGANEYYDRRDRGPRKYTMGEVVEESATLSGWIEPSGRVPNLPKLTLEEAEFLGKCRLSDLPGRQSVHEATGNEGATVELQYQTAVVVLWPQAGLRKVLVHQGQEHSLPQLRAALEGESPSNLRAWAEEILTAWKFFQPRYHFYSRRSAPLSGLMLRCLARLGEPALGVRFLREVLWRDYDGSEGPALVEMAEALGWSNIRPGLEAFLLSQSPESGSLKSLLTIVECLIGQRPSEERGEICRQVFPSLEVALAAFDARPRTEYERSHLIGPLLNSLAAAQAEESSVRVARHIIEQSKLYDLHRVVIPFLLQKPTASAGQRLLLEHSIEALRQSTSQEVVFPKDWSIPVQVPCSCAPCREAERFLHSAQEKVHLYRAREDLRLHLQYHLSGLDLEFSTVKGRSPHALRCEKNHASYVKRQRQFEVDRGLLEQLQSLS